jgi:hypothetical protein
MNPRATLSRLDTRLTPPKSAAGVVAAGLDGVEVAGVEVAGVEVAGVEGEDGSAPVVKVLSAPFAVPPAFVATSR